MGLSYKGYYISLRPLKTDNLWQLELEKVEEKLYTLTQSTPKKHFYQLKNLH